MKKINETEIYDFFENLPKGEYMVNFGHDQTLYEVDSGYWSGSHILSEICETIAIKEGIDVYTSDDRFMIVAHYGDFETIVTINRIN